MKNIIIILLIMMLSGTVLYAVDINTNIYAEYGGQGINTDSKMNPDNVMDLGTSRNMMLGSVAFRNKFNEFANGVFKLEAKYIPADYDRSNESEDIYVKELYVDLLNNYFNTRIGKQYMKWGDGVFFNPADVVNVSRDPLRPVSEAEGNRMLHVSVPFGSIASLDLLTISKKDENGHSKDFADQPGIARLSSTFGNVSSFVYGYFQQHRKALYGYDLNLALALTNETDIYFYSEGLFKGESERQYVDKTWTPQQRKHDIYYGISSGFRITTKFSSLKRFDSLTFLAEYYHDNENWTKSENNNMLNSIILYPDNKLQYIPFKSSRNYLYCNLSISNVFIDYLELELGNVMNLQDYSGIAIGTISYAYNDDTEIGIKGNYYYGDNDSEFGNALLNYQVVGYVDISF